jgi:ribosomal protein S18 acetylase RimI-like enzyme
VSVAIIGGMEIVVLGPDDADKVSAAAQLFDDAPSPEATSRFLSDPNHHMLIAYDDGVAVGFVSGAEVTHPDKGTEMFLYELGVAEDHRRRGIGTNLVQRLASIARARGCYGMWVLTDETNAAALATYQHAGANRERDPQVMLSWQFNDTKQ